MKVKQSLFTANVAMEKYFDEYDHYNFDRKYVEPHTRKGRSKKAQKAAKHKMPEDLSLHIKRKANNT